MSAATAPGSQALPGLRGVRVLDFGRYVAAPYCAMLLADMGADVIRVERPGGEDDRWLGLKAAHGEAFTFVGLARAKRGITLDLRAGAAARSVLADLVARCDVLLHNFAPAAAAALGLSYEELRASRPELVYLAISCHGPDGPHAKRGGFDPMAQMASGAAALTGYEDGPPVRAGVPWVDFSTGLAGALGVLLALRHREATGQGQSVDCALLRTALSYTAPMVAEAVVAGRERPRLGNQAAYVAPSNLYRCRDGAVYVAAVTAGAWRALARLVGEPELANDPELASPEQRFEQRARIEPVIERWTERRTVAEVLHELEEARVPGGSLQATRELPDDPQVRAQGMLEYVDLGLDGLEQVPVSASPLRLSRISLAAGGAPPRVGEHNDEVYRGLLGYSDETIAALRADSVI